MSRSIIIKASIPPLLAALIALSLTLQAIAPIVVYADTEATTTEIQTGDALAGLDLQNEINTTEIDTDSPPEEASLIEDLSEETLLELPLFLSDTEITASTTNLATSTTNATSVAQTGDNTATGGGDTTITTGDAIAYVDLLNVVNTNIVNSDGLITFINDTLGYGTFDLRPDFDLVYADFDTAVSTATCDSVTCADQFSKNTSTNTAAIDNTVTVVADTGLNTGSGEDVTIETGDAYASANIINVANTNIVDSQYLLLIFNNFNDFTGDIVLPSSSFFDQFLTPNAIIPGDITLNNQATVENNSQVIADTGNNTSTGDGGTVDTGAAVATSNTTNLVNQNLIGGSTFSMLIRVHGDWTGTIAGLPAGLTWRETERGIEIISADSSLPGLPIESSNVDITNTASIHNNVQVYALTGDNEAAGANASINTGNAYADSSIMNIVNSNIIGSNWSNLIFNIYGNWNGNLTFGQPDLWLGMTASAPTTPIMPGAPITYTFTVFNHGDATAPAVTLEGLFENDALAFTEGNATELSNGYTRQQWSLGDIGPGETREFTHVAQVSEKLDRGMVSAVPLSGRVTSSQNDANDTDNEEVVTIYVGKKRTHGSNSNRKTFPAHFDITKTASRDLAQPGDTVDYTITFFNRGGPLFDSLLVDTLENEAGEIIKENTWPLSEIKNGETITVSYSMEFDSSMPVGKYTNYAQLIGFHESRREANQRPYESSVASHTLDLGISPEGRVLGMQDCATYLTTYLRYGGENDPSEVQKLQTFLNEQFDRHLDVSGYFDLATEQAVRDFQILHRDEVLTPWGLVRDSGYVYYTTQRKINEIMCQGTKTFALNDMQQSEIATYRGKLANTDNMHFLPPSPIKQPLSLPPSITPTLVAPSGNKESINTESPQELLTEILPEIETVRPPRFWSGVKQWWQSFTINTTPFWRR